MDDEWVTVSVPASWIRWLDHAAENLRRAEEAGASGEVRGALHVELAMILGGADAARAELPIGIANALNAAAAQHRWAAIQAKRGDESDRAPGALPR